MSTVEVLMQVRTAFADTPHPGDGNIVRCEYDRRLGGPLDGPCRECSEVVSYFKGRTNTSFELEPDQLNGIAFALHSFSPEAFRYWLPLFMEAALLHPDRCDKVSESLEFRFESLDSLDWQTTHFSALTLPQLEAVASYFTAVLDRPGEYAPTIHAALATIREWCIRSALPP